MGLLGEALSSLKRLEEGIFAQRDDLVDTSDQYFERIKENMAFFYLELELS